MELKMNMDPIRLGILGCGSWGPQYIRALQGLQSVKLVVVADPIIERARKAATLSEGVLVMSDIEEVCQMPDLDAVILATPTPTHHRLATLALAAGKHILVEKPIGLNLQEAQSMISTAETNDRLMMAGQIMRFMPGVAEVRKRLMAGVIGKPLQVVERRYGAFRADAGPDWWKKMDGFLLLHLGSHSVDAIFWILGKNPEWAFAQGYARKIDPEYGAIDAYTMTIGLEGQVLAGLHHEATSGAANLVYNLLLIGETGRIELDEFSIVHQNGTEVFRQPGDCFQMGLRAEVQELATAIREGRQPSVTGRDILPTVACLDAARLSLHSQRLERVQA
jgi:predicted dehydrogenase